MNRPPTCIFDVNEMGNKEFTWSGLSSKARYGYSMKQHTLTIALNKTNTICCDSCQMKLFKPKVGCNLRNQG